MIKREKIRYLSPKQVQSFESSLKQPVIIKKSKVQIQAEEKQWKQFSLRFLKEAIQRQQRLKQQQMKYRKTIQAKEAAQKIKIQKRSSLHLKQLQDKEQQIKRLQMQKRSVQASFGTNSTNRSSESSKKRTTLQEKILNSTDLMGDNSIRQINSTSSISESNDQMNEEMGSKNTKKIGQHFNNNKQKNYNKEYSQTKIGRTSDLETIIEKDQSQHLFSKNNSENKPQQIIQSTTTPVIRTLFSQNKSKTPHNLKEKQQVNEQNTNILLIPRHVSNPSSNPHFQPNRSQSSQSTNSIVPHNLQRQVNQQPSLIIPPSITRLQVIPNLSANQYLQRLISFSKSQKKQVEIPTNMSNLGGARSKIADVLSLAKSLINSLPNRYDDKQQTTFAIKLFDAIVHTHIQSAKNNGLEVMPPSLKTKPVQKTSINCYILIVNLYRVMNYQKVWLVVVSKTIQFLSFLFKRTTPLQNHTQLQLIINNYITLKDQIAARYLQRIDYLTYFLFGLLLFDPLKIFKLIAEKQSQHIPTLNEVSSFNYQWDYSYFWVTLSAISASPSDKYFHPVLFMNLMTVLYPHVRNDRKGPFGKVFVYALQQCQGFFQGLTRNEEAQNLFKDYKEQREYAYDGETFEEVLGTLKNRTNQKAAEFKKGVREYDQCANIFFYFFNLQ